MTNPTRRRYQSKGSHPNTSALPIALQRLLDTLERHRQTYTHQQSADEVDQVRFIGQLIRSTRKAKGYSRLQLAELIGEDMALLVAVENGIGSRRVAKALLAKVQTLHLEGIPSLKR